MRIVPLIWSSGSLLLACLSMAACTPPKSPDEERRPDPQVSRASGPTSAIVQSAEAYKDRARSAEESQLDAADQHRAEIDAQTQ
ncbi:MAG: hypothetical protein ABIP16_05910 [Thermomonas sp.]